MAIPVSKEVRSLALQLHAVSPSNYSDVIKRVCGLANRPDVFTQYSFAKKSADNQSRMTGNSAFVMEFGSPYAEKSNSGVFGADALTSVHVFVVAASYADESKLRKFGFFKK